MLQKNPYDLEFLRFYLNVFDNYVAQWQHRESVYDPYWVASVFEATVTGPSPGPLTFAACHTTRFAVGSLSNKSHKSWRKSF